MTSAGGMRLVPCTLREFVVCSQCGRNALYMEEPVILPCLHSLCIQCLKTRVELSLRNHDVECPKCTHWAPIPPGGLKAFPEGRFCRVAFKTLIDPEYQYLPGGPNPKCGLHPMDEITGYCQECLVQVCGKCVTSYHKNHREKTQSLSDVSARMESELTSLLEEKTYQVATSLQNIQHSRAKMKSNIQEVKQAVEDRAQKLHKEIEKLKQQKLNELEQIANDHDAPFQEALLQLEKFQSVLRDYREFVDILKKRGKASDTTAYGPGLQQLLHQKAEVLQFEPPIWQSNIVLQVPFPKATQLFGTVEMLNMLQRLHSHKSISITCQNARFIRHIKLFGKHYIIHSYEDKQICFHTASCDTKKRIPITQLTEASSMVAADPTRGVLVVADSDQYVPCKHRGGALHWLTLSESLSKIHYDRTGLECMPRGHLNVDQKGHLLVITGCESNQHPQQVAIFDRHTHAKLRTIALPPSMLYPMAAMPWSRKQPEHTATGFVIVHSGGRRGCITWLDEEGTALMQYGEKPEETLSEPRHLVQTSDRNFLISDHGNHRILLVSNQGTLIQNVQSEKGQRIPNPDTLHLDEQEGLLAVGSFDGNSKRVEILNFLSYK